MKEENRETEQEIVKKEQKMGRWMDMGGKKREGVPQHHTGRQPSGEHVWVST